MSAALAVNSMYSQSTTHCAASVAAGQGDREQFGFALLAHAATRFGSASTVKAWAQMRCGLTGWS
jgi:hypothetical protein